jgi:ABC-type uncharacterized transport system permease subunit
MAVSRVILARMREFWASTYVIVLNELTYVFSLSAVAKGIMGASPFSNIWPFSAVVAFAAIVNWGYALRESLVPRATTEYVKEGLVEVVITKPKALLYLWLREVGGTVIMRFVVSTILTAAIIALLGYNPIVAFVAALLGNLALIALLVLLSAATFWTVEPVDNYVWILWQWLDSYPADIFKGSIIELIILTAIPVYYATTLPTKIILHMPAEHIALGVITTVVFSVAAYLLLKEGMKRYEGAGG